MLLTCPNGKGFDIETLGVLSNSVDVEHLNYFNPQSLAGLIMKCGLHILECFTPGKLDAELIKNKILSGEFSLKNQSFLKIVLVDEWDKFGKSFQDYLVQQGLSSNLWIVAQKPLF